MIVAVVAGVGCGGGGGDSPEGTAEEFYSAVADGDAEAACALYGGPDAANVAADQVGIYQISPILYDPEVDVEEWERGTTCEEAISNVPESVRTWAGEAEIGEPEISDIPEHAAVPVDLGDGGEVTVAVFKVDESGGESESGEWKWVGPGT